MSPLPGTTITTKDSPPSRNLPVDTSVLFAVGTADRGPAPLGDVQTPRKVRNMTEFELYFGKRQSYSILWDSLDTFFKEGGGQAYIERVVGPAAVTATKNFNDRAGSPLPTLRVDAINPGAWGNALTVSVANGVGANTFVLTVKESGVTLEQSTDLSSPADAVGWGNNSLYVRVFDLASATAAPNNNPVVIGDTALLTGADDRASITDTHWKLALDRFTKELGPGQVTYPGRTAAQGYLDLLSHAFSNDRVALLDGTDTATSSTLTGAAATTRTSAGTNARYGALFAPWVKIAGITFGTQRVVPPSMLVAGAIARSEGLGNSPNVPAAGDNGAAINAFDVSQTPWDDTTRDTLNNAGVNVIKTVNGIVEVYGWRTLVNNITDYNWTNFGNARLHMAVRAKANEIALRYVFSELDGRRRTIAAFGGDLKGMLMPYWEAGSLYGDTPAEAFVVDVGPSVNTDDTIAQGLLKAQIALRMSPFGEQVIVEIIKVAITQALA